MRTEQQIIDELLERKKNGLLTENGFNEVCRRPPLRKDKIAIVEDMLGYPLPELLKRMYCEVANGGYGEAYGLIGLIGGARDDSNSDVRQLLKRFQKIDKEDPKWKWPDGMLPAISCGCAMYLCIDCRDDKGKVILFEPNIHEEGDSWKSSFIKFSPSLRRLMNDWLDEKDLWQNTL